IYWKYVSGDWLFYSYGKEGFDFSKPRIWDGLFSFQNGWFAYTPLMFLATAGTFWLLKYRDWLLPFALFFTFQIYIAYSWWCWYYINGFGSRPMVETYAMVSIALGYLVAMCMQKAFTKYLLIGAIGFLTWLNIFQTYQFYKSIMFSESANWAYYQSIFGKTKLEYLDFVPKSTSELQPDTSQLKLIKSLYFNDFESEEDTFNVRTLVKNGKRSHRMIPDLKHGPSWRKNAKELGIQAGDWIKLGVWAYRAGRKPGRYNMTQLRGIFENKERKIIKWSHLDLEDKMCVKNGYTVYTGKKECWDYLYYYTQVPEDFTEKDFFRIELYKRKGFETYFDDLSVEHFVNDQ
ncbi:MAG: hypothetical protein ACPGXL_05285, partial [Chitinophagales bacterium]